MISSCLRRGRLFRWAGVLAVVLALAGRLAGGMAVADVRAAGDLAAVLDAAVFCGDNAPPTHDRAPPARHAALALATILADPAPTLTPAIARPAPRQASIGCALAPSPGHAPQSVRLSAAFPRGPPIPA